MVGRGIYAVLLVSWFWGIESFPHEDSTLSDMVGRDSEIVPVNITEYPFTARYHTRNNARLCSAAIVHEKFLLTSAICSFSLEHDRSKTYVSVGTDDMEDDGETHEVDAAYLHPNFMYFESLDYNIAVLKLVKPLKFNDKIKAIALPKQDFVVPEEAVFDALGYYIRIVDKNISLHLSKQSVSYISPEKCEELNIPVTKRMICAGKGFATFAEDANPLIYKNMLLGIYTYWTDLFDNDVPRVYTSIAAVRGFIDNIIKTKA